MVSPGDWKRLQTGKWVQDGFWTFALQPAGNGQCRLIALVRSSKPATFTSAATGRFVLGTDPLHHGTMEQNMLRTIRDLSEQVKIELQGITVGTYAVQIYRQKPSAGT